MLRRLPALAACLVALTSCAESAAEEPDYWTRPAPDVPALLERARAIDVCALLGPEDLASVGINDAATSLDPSTCLAGFIADPEPGLVLTWAVSSVLAQEPPRHAVPATIDGAPATVLDEPAPPGGHRICSVAVRIGAELELTVDLSAAGTADLCAAASRLAGAAAARWRAEPQRATAPFANTDPCAATAALGVAPETVEPELWHCSFRHRDDSIMLTLEYRDLDELGEVVADIDGRPVFSDTDGLFVNEILKAQTGPAVPMGALDGVGGPRGPVVTVVASAGEVIGSQRDTALAVLRAAVPLAAG